MKVPEPGKDNIREDNKNPFGQGEVIKPGGWLESLNCAIEGVIYAFKTQRHIRYHYIIAVSALLLSLFLRLPTTEFVLFSIAVVILLFAEMMNTAVEEAVNLIEEKHHITARNAKDVSAGAVLISSIGVAIMLYLIFVKYLHGPAERAMAGFSGFSGHMAIVSLFLVLIAVVVLKATFHRGTPLHGGLPSGHAAVAFSLSTSITLLTLEPMAAILSFVMALMVSHSRLLGGIHTRLEVVLGALLGTGLTLLVFYLFHITGK